MAAGSYECELVTSFRIARSAGRVPDGSLIRASVLGEALALAGRSDPSITDFGGATGDLGLDVLQAYPAARYTVVETPAMVAHIGARGALSFTTTIPRQCDIFFTSGTIQYLADPMTALKQGFESARFLAVLARNSFADREIFRVQRSALYENGNGPIPPGFYDRIVSYPHRTLIEADVIRLAQSCGLTCISATPETGGAVRGAYGRRLVFRRK